MLFAMVTTAVAGVSTVNLWSSQAAGGVSGTNNLLTGKVFSSTQPESVDEPGHPVSYITDGNNNSRWISVDASPVTLTADLGTVYQLSKVSINWAGDTVKNFQIQVSTNNSNWTTIITGQTSNVTPEYRDYVGFSAPAIGRYFRIIGLDRWDSSYGNSIWEAGVYGTQYVAPTPPPTPAPTPAPTSTPRVTTPPSNPTPAPVAPAITAFQAIPSSVAMGGQTTLYWSATSANAGCSISPGGPSGLMGTSWSTPALTTAGPTTYTLTCTNSAGQTTNRTTTVTVVGPTTAPAKPVLTASNTYIPSGTSVMLYWSATGASACTLNPGDITTGGGTGSHAVIVNATTIYTVECTNSAGTTTSDPVTISTGDSGAASPDPNIAFFAAQPANIQPGSTSTISWATSNVATGACNLNDTPLTTASASGLWTTPVLQTSASFTITCISKTGTVVSRTVSIQVGTSAPASAAASITPIVNSDDATAASLKSSTGQTVANSSVSGQVAGLMVLDPALVTNADRQKATIKVEYYEASTLVQSDITPPYALDTTSLANASHSLTERIYYADGSRSEITRSVEINNSGSKAAAKSTKSTSSTLLIVLGVLVPLIILGVSGFFGWRWFSSRQTQSVSTQSLIDKINRY